MLSNDLRKVKFSQINLKGVTQEQVAQGFTMSPVQLTTYVHGLDKSVYEIH